MSTFAENVSLPAKERELEETRVARWRFEQFCVLGFEADDAFFLAVSRVDLQAARTLVGSGCPPELALRILL